MPYGAVPPKSARDGAQIRGWLAAGGLRGRTSLDLMRRDLDAAGLAEIVSSPTLSQVRKLWLIGNRIGDEGKRLLAASPYVTELTELNLAANGIGPVGARALANWPYFHNLTHLWLTQHGLIHLALAGPTMFDPAEVVARAQHSRGQRLLATMSGLLGLTVDLWRVVRNTRDRRDGLNKATKREAQIQPHLLAVGLQSHAGPGRHTATVINRPPAAANRVDCRAAAPVPPAQTRWYDGAAP